MTRVNDAPVVDLDALRKARADGGPKRRTFIFDGHRYSVAARIPLYVSMLVNDQNMTQAMRLWLGDDQFDRLMATDFNEDDLQEVMTALYGDQLGEVSGPVDSSTSTRP